MLKENLHAILRYEIDGHRRGERSFVLDELWRLDNFYVSLTERVNKKNYFTRR